VTRRIGIPRVAIPIGYEFALFVSVGEKRVVNERCMGTSKEGLVQ